MDGGAVDDQIRLPRLAASCPMATRTPSARSASVFWFLDIGAGNGEAAAVQDLISG